MIYRTFGELREQVEAELDTQDEEFIQPAEIQNYFNSAVTLCEATIVKLGLRERYLQDEAVMDVVKGQADYALPADLVITKIRKIVYRNQQLVYTIHPLKRESGYAVEDAYNAAGNNTGEDYRWSIYKKSTDYKLRLVPSATLSVTGGLRLIYFKSLNRYVSDTTVCDLPEICYEYLMSYVRYRIYAKESHTNTPDEKANMQALLGLMQETLQNQVADPDMDLVDGDFSHYEEMN